MALLLGGGGCTRELTYEATRADGTRERFTSSNVGFDTKVGKLVVTRQGDAVHVEVENLDSQSQAMKLAAEAIKVAEKVAAAGVKP